MTETTEAGVPDFAAIRQEARHVPKFRDDQADEKAAYGERLRGYVVQLLAALHAAPAPVGEDAARVEEWTTRLSDWARHTLEHGVPGDPFHLENLASHCRLLAAVTAQPADLMAYCCWCKSFRLDTRVIQCVETSSAEGVAQSACPECRYTHDLIPLSDRPVAA